VSTVLLVRHGRTAANAGGLLAGWTPGVVLDETGLTQARSLGERIAALPLAAIVSSPLERCQQTASAVLGARSGPLVETDDRLGECHYGEWTGKEIKALAKDPLWRVVQAHPSAVTFPGGESMRAMQDRAVDAVREVDARLGGDAVWVAVSHGDVIKAVLADAMGLHLDQFQRLVIDPCSVTAVRYTQLRPFVLRVNDIGGDLVALAPPARSRRRRRPASSDAVVGGGAGSDCAGPDGAGSDGEGSAPAASA
jgi:probable phosphomutase (TIGR03848 family)